jgi:hypothetical protein
MTCPSHSSQWCSVKISLNKSLAIQIIYNHLTDWATLGTFSQHCLGQVMVTKRGFLQDIPKFAITSVTLFSYNS